MSRSRARIDARVCSFATGISAQNGSISDDYGHYVAGYCAETLAQMRMHVFNGGEWLLFIIYQINTVS